MEPMTWREGAPDVTKFGPVRLTVREADEDILVYTFASVREAAEIHGFIREFFPRAEFRLEPLPQ